MKARVHDIELEYEDMGERAGAPVLLVSGLSEQLIAWRDDFCRLLCQRGFRVIRFDNRDVGLSTKMTGAGKPDTMAALMALQAGEPVKAPYTLGDMAADALGLLDALGLETAHVAGVSMGGMIAQEMALREPRRVRSLCAIMSTTNERSLPGPRPEIMALMLTLPPRERDACVESSVRLRRALAGSGFPFDAAEAATQAGRGFDRCYYPEGIGRQLLAIWGAHGRRAALRNLHVPTVVIHGRDDPMLPLANGEDIAAAVPAAELVVIDGMGHDLPRTAWPRIIDAIARNAARAP